MKWIAPFISSHDIDGPVTLGGWGPDSSWLAATGGGVVTVVEADTGTALWTVGRPDKITSVALSGDKKTLASASSDGAVQVFDTATGGLRRSIKRAAPVNAVGLGPDGAWVAIGGMDETTSVLEVASGAEWFRLLHDGPVNVVAVSPDGLSVASGGDDPEVQLVNARTGAVRSVLSHTGAVTALTWSRDGTILATGDDSGVARVFDAGSGRPRSALEHTGPVNDVAISPDGIWVVTASLDRTAHVFHVDSGAERFSKTHDGAVRAVAWNKSGKWVGTAADSGALLFDPDTGEERFRIEDGQTVHTIGFSPDGQRVALGGGRGTARVHSLATVRELYSITHEFPMGGVCLSSDGRWLASDYNKVFDAVDGSLRCRLEESSRSLKFSPNGNWVSAGPFVMDAKTGARRCYAENGDISLAKWSPRGQWIATYGTRGTDISDLIISGCLQVSNARTGAKRWRIFEENGRSIWVDLPTPFAWSPDGRKIAAYTPDLGRPYFDPAGPVPPWDNPLLLLDARTGEVNLRIPHGDAKVLSLAWSPDGTLVVTGSDTSAQVFDATTGVRRRLLVADFPARWVMWSADGHTVGVAGGAADGGGGRAFAFDAQSGAERFRADFPGLRLVEWSPNGKRLAVVGHQGVFVLDATTGSMLRRLGADEAAAALSWDGDGRCLATVSDPATEGARPTGRVYDLDAVQPD
ncbi:hypothetical protein ACFYNL_05905 [Streptomyces sp. NPDC007808]|uniref:hypothetical protein n=1 Tax=Streptomyces sp. NPDC007808 TaxID=3364779 RepID=UPI0036CCDB5F